MPRRRRHHWLFVVRLVGGLKIAFLPRSVVARVPIVRVEIFFGWRVLRRLRLIWLACLTRGLRRLGRWRAKIRHVADDVAKSFYRFSFQMVRVSPADLRSPPCFVSGCSFS
jgi:hypothetical protein